MKKLSNGLSTFLKLENTESELMAVTQAGIIVESHKACSVLGPVLFLIYKMTSLTLVAPTVICMSLRMMPSFTGTLNPLRTRNLCN